MMTNIKCSIKSIVCSKKIILKNIDFEVNGGEVLLIRGKSGSGKSTILSFIGGILQEDKNFKIDGECVLSCDKSSIAYKVQNPDANLISNEVISEIFLKAGNLNPSIIGTLNEFNLDEKILKKKVKDLSDGQKQLLSIVCSLLTNSQIFLFD